VANHDRAKSPERAGAGHSIETIGILDIRDAMKALYEQEELQEQLLANYVAGIGYQ
jgi:hypothetical protein